MERIFNLFVFVDRGIIQELGASVHQQGDRDDAKIRYLQSCVRADFPMSSRRPLPNRYRMVDESGYERRGAITYEAFRAFQMMGNYLDIFEEFFRDLHAPQNPLCVVTPIVNGEARVDEFVRFGGET